MLGGVVATVAIVSRFAVRLLLLSRGCPT